MRKNDWVTSENKEITKNEREKILRIEKGQNTVNFSKFSSKAVGSQRYGVF